MLTIDKLNEYPKQGSWLNRRVNVCFNYDTSKTFAGTIIREDEEAPHLTFIALDDGRIVLSLECQFSMLKDNVCTH